MGYWLCFVFRLGIKNYVIVLVLAKTANVQVLWHAMQCYDQLRGRRTLTAGDFQQNQAHSGGSISATSSSGVRRKCGCRLACWVCICGALFETTDVGLFCFFKCKSSLQPTTDSPTNTDW